MADPDRRARRRCARCSATLRCSAGAALLYWLIRGYGISLYATLAHDRTTAVRLRAGIAAQLGRAHACPVGARHRHRRRARRRLAVRATSRSRRWSARSWPAFCSALRCSAGSRPRCSISSCRRTSRRSWASCRTSASSSTCSWSAWSSILSLLRKRGHATLAISHASIVTPFLLGAALALLTLSAAVDARRARSPCSRCSWASRCR